MALNKLAQIEGPLSNLPCAWEDAAAGVPHTFVVLGTQPYGVKKATGNTVPLRGLLKFDTVQNGPATVRRTGIVAILCGAGGLAIDDPVTSDANGKGVKATFNATTGNKYIGGYCWQAAAAAGYALIDLDPSWYSQ